MEYIIDEIRGDPEKDEETKEAEVRHYFSIKFQKYFHFSFPAKIFF